MGGEIASISRGLLWRAIFPTPARGNANGISEIIKQKEKGAVIGELFLRLCSVSGTHVAFIVPGLDRFGTMKAISLFRDA